MSRSRLTGLKWLWIGWLALGGAAAQADTLILPGFDLFHTTGGSQDFAHDPIPADFFAPGSEPFTGIVILAGSPTGPGDTDTVVQRFSGAMIPDPTPVPIPIELVGLSLKSVMPITVTYAGGSFSELWDVKIVIPPPAPPPSNMQIQQLNPNGGTFSATLPVMPIFTFTRLSGPPAVVNRLSTDILNILGPWSLTPPTLDAHDGIHPSGGYYGGVDPLTNQRVVFQANGLGLDLLLTPATIPAPSAAAFGLLLLAGLRHRRA